MAARYPDQVEARIYRAGKDLDYVLKYGPVMRGTLIIDGRIRIERLNRSVIEDAIEAAVREVTAC